MTILRQKISLRALFLAVILVCLLTEFVIALEHEHLFNSPVFGNPEHVYEMSRDWIDKPVTYPADVGEVDLYMTLSYQLYDFLADKIRQFATVQGFTVAIKKTSCSTSTRLLMEKEVDIASFCSSPSLNDRLPGIKFHTAGLIPVAVLVNKSNPVKNVSLDDLMKIFRGEIVNWSQLGGEDLLIQPVARLHCKTRPGRWRPLDTPDELSQSVTLVGAIDDNLEFISRTRGSIGYESLPGGLKEKYRGLKRLSIDGVDSTDLRRMAEGDYPYFRTYTFTLWKGVKQHNKHAKQVIELIDNEMASLHNGLRVLASKTLKGNGWQFSEDELVGLPE